MLEQSPALPLTADPTVRVPRRLVPFLGLFMFIVQGALTATAGTLLPNQLAELDAPSKVANLAMVTSVSAAFALVVQPLVGSLSDRTRNRLGRRTPWMLAGALVATGALAIVGHLDSIPTILVCWIALQIGFNMMLGPNSAILADRVPVSRRGVASGVIGLGLTLGLAVGTVAAASLAADLPVAYTGFGVVLLAFIVVFIVVNRERSTRDKAFPAFRWRAFFTGFWVSPRKHPDFAWAFAARFLFVLSFNAVYGFSLYILSDYVGLGMVGATHSIVLVSAGVVLGSIVAVLLGGWLSDRIGRRKPFIYAASAAIALGLAALLISPTLPAAILMGVLLGAGYGLYQASDTALMTQVLPDAAGAAGKDLGILNLANSIPIALAPALGGGLVLASGGYAALFAVGILIALIAAFVVIPIRSVR